MSEVNREALLNILEQAKLVIPSDTTTDMYKNVCFRDGTISATDGGRFIKAYFGVGLDFSVSADLLIKLIKTMKTELVSLELVGKNLIVKSGKAKGSFTIDSSENFPVLQDMDELDSEGNPILDWKPFPVELTEILQKIKPFPSADATHRVLANVFVEDNNIIATNGSQMGWCTSEALNFGTFSLSSKFVEIFLQLGTPSQIAFDYDVFRMFIKYDGMMFSELFSTAVPPQNWRFFYPNSNTVTLTEGLQIDKDAFTEAIKTVSPFIGKDGFLNLVKTGDSIFIKFNDENTEVEDSVASSLFTDEVPSVYIKPKNLLTAFDYCDTFGVFKSIDPLVYRLYGEAPNFKYISTLAKKQDD